MIDGERYTVHNMHTVPREVHPRQFSEKKNDTHLTFGGIHIVYNPLSNWYPCKVNFNDHEFDSSEQAYQWAKADYCKHACISIFSKIGLIDQSKPCAQIYLQKMTSCINLQLPIVILKNSILLDMHHHKTYMYIFCKIRVNKSVKTVRRNKFAKNGKLHKFATTNSILNESLLLDMHHRITSKYIKYLQISQVA